MAATTENDLPYPRRRQYQCAGHWRDWMARKETYIQCEKIGTKLCPCHLVAYCSRECQIKNWSEHKTHCQDDVRKSTWQPKWVRENRPPEFTSSDELEGGFSYMKCLWGSVPAFDVLNLRSSEGLDYNEDMNVCFANSGDLRNILLSVNGLPSGYTGTFTCVINDYNDRITGRNVIMLLAAMYLPLSDAAEFILHIWYSSGLTENLKDTLQSVIIPLVADVVKGFENRSPNILLAKTFERKLWTLSVKLFRDQWRRLRGMLETYYDYNELQGTRIRAMMVDQPGQDRRERHMFNLSGSKRAGFFQAGIKGILLPMGIFGENYEYPKPTLYDFNGDWYQNSFPDVLDGWQAQDVYRSGKEHGYPEEDVYGHLYIHVLEELETFCQRSRYTKAKFHVYNLDPCVVPIWLPGPVKLSGFDRIEVGNMADVGYYGLYSTLSKYGPLLKTRAQNPHAVLISHFKNALEMAELSMSAERQRAFAEKTLARMVSCFDCPEVTSKYDPRLLQFSSKMQYFRDLDPLFNTYMLQAGFVRIAKKCKMVMKSDNSVVVEWLGFSRHEPDDPGLRAAWEKMMESSGWGHVRMVEWRRNATTRLALCPPSPEKGTPPSRAPFQSSISLPVLPSPLRPPRASTPERSPTQSSFDLSTMSPPGNYFPPLFPPASTSRVDWHLSTSPPPYSPPPYFSPRLIPLPVSPPSRSLGSSLSSSESPPGRFSPPLFPPTPSSRRSSQVPTSCPPYSPPPYFPSIWPSPRLIPLPASPSRATTWPSDFPQSPSPWPSPRLVPLLASPPRVEPLPNDSPQSFAPWPSPRLVPLPASPPQGTPLPSSSPRSSSPSTPTPRRIRIPASRRRRILRRSSLPPPIPSGSPPPPIPPITLWPRQQPNSRTVLPPTHHISTVSPSTELRPIEPTFSKSALIEPASAEAARTLLALRTFPQIDSPATESASVEPTLIEPAPADLLTTEPSPPESPRAPGRPILIVQFSSSPLPDSPNLPQVTVVTDYSSSSSPPTPSSSPTANPAAPTSPSPTPRSPHQEPPSERQPSDSSSTNESPVLEAPPTRILQIDSSPTSPDPSSPPPTSRPAASAPASPTLPTPPLAPSSPAQLPDSDSWTWSPAAEAPETNTPPLEPPSITISPPSPPTNTPITAPCPAVTSPPRQESPPLETSELYALSSIGQL